MPINQVLEPLAFTDAITRATEAVGRRYAQDAQMMGMDLANLHASRMNPLLLEQQRTANQSSAIDLDLKEFEKPLKKKKSIRDDQLEQMATFGNMAGNLGSYLINLPPGMSREAAASQWMQDNGIDPKSSVGQTFLRTNPKNLIGMADDINRRTAAYRQAIDVQLLENQGRLQAARLSGQGSGESIETILAKQSPAEQMSYWITQATKAQQSGNNAEALRYWERAQALAPTATAQYYGNNQNVGKLDISALNPNLKTVPVPNMLPPMPQQNLGRPPQQPTGSQQLSTQQKQSMLQRYKQQYPNKSEAEIKAAVKQRLGIDL